MKEPGATVAGSESAKLLHSSLNSHFFSFLSHKGYICNNNCNLLCVSSFFKLSLLGNLALCGTITNSCAAEWRKCKVKSVFLTRAILWCISWIISKMACLILSRKSGNSSKNCLSKKEGGTQ
jgi:hypothetical protein